jgi:hypothetical protein
LFWFLQPSTASQLSSVQGLLSLQLRGPPPPHVPDVHVSPTVQALLSLHDPPSLAACFPQVPVVVLQTPRLHWSLVPVQSTRATASQVPAASPSQR